MKTNNAVKFLGALGVATATTLTGASEASAVQIFTLDNFNDPQFQVVDTTVDGIAVSTTVSNLADIDVSDFPVDREASVNASHVDNPFDPPSLSVFFSPSVGSGVADLSLTAGAEADFGLTYTPTTGDFFDLLSGASMMATDLIVTLDILESPDELVPITLNITDFDGDMATTTKNISATAGPEVVAFDFLTDFPANTFGFGPGEVNLLQTAEFDLLFDLPKGTDVQLKQIHTEVIPFEKETSAGLALLVGYGAWRRWKSRRA